MAESKKIVVSMPKTLLNEIDGIVSIEKKNRTEFIREAMKLYIREREKIQIKEHMKIGYREMASINLAISEMGIEQYDYELCDYEAKLTGCD